MGGRLGVPPSSRHLLVILLLSLTSAAAQARPHRHGSLVLTTSIYGATVKVDGHPSGTTPISHPISLKPGPHTVHVEKLGYQDFDQKFTITPDSSTPIFVQLQKAPSSASAASPAGDLALIPIATAPAEKIAAAAPAPPPPGPPVASSSSTMVLTPDIADLTQPPSLVNPNPLAAPPLQTEATLTTDNWYNQWWIWTIAGVVVAGAAAGVTYGVLHGHQSNTGTAPNATWSLGNPISATQGFHVNF